MIYNWRNVTDWANKYNTKNWGLLIDLRHNHGKQEIRFSLLKGECGTIELSGYQDQPFSVSSREEIEEVIKLLNFYKSQI